MKGIRAILLAAVGCLLMVLGLAGCSGDGSSLTGVPNGDSTGTVKVFMTRGTVSRALPMPVELALLFNEVDLIPIDCDVDAQTPTDYLPDNLINPDFPIPLIGSATMLDLLTGNIAQTSPTITTEIPAGVYQSLRLTLDQAFAEVAEDSDLPFDPHTLAAIVPINGEGLRVDPGEVKTIIVNLTLMRADVLEDGDTDE